MSVLRREQYPPLNVFERQAPFGWQFRYYYDFLLRQFAFLPSKGSPVAQLSLFVGPIFLGVLGLLHGLRRLRPWIWLLLVGYLVNADGLTLYLNFTDHEVRERDYFYGTAFMFFAMLIGLGAAALLRYAAGKEGPAWSSLKPGQRASPVRTSPLIKGAAALLVVIAALPVLVPGHVKWFEHDRSDNWIPREYAWNMLAGLDEGAILFTNGDNDTFPIWYLQEVERFRRDVTVVNLSLINLPWYIKQMRRRDPPMPLGYTDAQVDQLQPAVYEDINTGQRQLIYVRDYILHDLIAANAKSGRPRPVCFAVTIPQENMARYYPNLVMEGLTFRLTEQAAPDGQPRVDPGRLLANMLGVYDYTAIQAGDSRARLSRYRELVGVEGEGRDRAAHLQGVVMPEVDLAPLVEMVGEPRADVYRDRNTSNLLGNYPTAAVRAAYEYLTAAQSTAMDDTVTYDRLIDQVAACLELARQFDPLYPPVTEIYPLILIEQARVDEALAYLESLRRRIAAEDEEALLYRSLLMLTGSGHEEAAFAFLERRMTADPREKTAYRLAFSLHRSLKQPEQCEQIIERWRQQSGEEDAEMTRSLETLRDELSGAQRPGSDGVSNAGGGAAERPSRSRPADAWWSPAAPASSAATCARRCSRSAAR
jgi:tetratricopeptide (TPR) repeat protein